MKISDKMRATWVKRWGIVRTLREQNIAEHSFMVAMIAEELIGRIGFPIDEGGGLSGARAGELLRWALWHDLAEVFTGDTPTPTKLKLRERAGDALQQIEDEIAPEVAEVRKQTNQLIIDVVKVADYLEAISFLQREAGNQEAVDVKNLLIKQLGDYISGWNSMMRRHKEEIYSVAHDMGITLG